MAWRPTSTMGEAFYRLDASGADEGQVVGADGVDTLSGEYPNMIMVAYGLGVRRDTQAHAPPMPPRHHSPRFPRLPHRHTIDPSRSRWGNCSERSR
jgi:hypothetical protein